MELWSPERADRWRRVVTGSGGQREDLVLVNVSAHGSTRRAARHGEVAHGRAFLTAHRSPPARAVLIVRS